MLSRADVDSSSPRALSSTSIPRLRTLLATRFPEGKVVFLAPTKPLVAQQISACYDVMGIPERDTAELQGSVTPEARRRLWDERRVFYCTPQSMVNDIKQRRCDPGKFVCVVVDEVKADLEGRTTRM